MMPSPVRQKRNRSTKKYSFPIPPRGYHCQDWLPLGKRVITIRFKSRHEQRLQVIELVVSQVLTLDFKLLSIEPQGDEACAQFALNSDDILAALMERWNNDLLRDYKGPTFRGNGWKTKKFEGKLGYCKLVKNWSDQHQWKVADTFWVFILDELASYVHGLAVRQYPANDTLQCKFEACLLCSSLYALCCSTVAFPQARSLPLFLETAMVRNAEIRKKFKEFEPNLNLYQFKEEESEKHNGERKICAAVKRRCVAYLGERVRYKLNEFYQLTHLHGNIEQLDLTQFYFDVKYAMDGTIGRDQAKADDAEERKEEEEQQPDAQREVEDDEMIEEDDENQPLQSVQPAVLPSISGTELSYAYLPPPVMPEETSTDHLSQPNGDMSSTASISYSASHGPSTRVAESRYSPYAHGEHGRVQYQHPVHALPYYYDSSRLCYPPYDEPYYAQFNLYHSYPPRVAEMGWVPFNGYVHHSPPVAECCCDPEVSLAPHMTAESVLRPGPSNAMLPGVPVAGSYAADFDYTGSVNQAHWNPAPTVPIHDRRDFDPYNYHNVTNSTMDTRNDADASQHTQYEATNMPHPFN